MPRLRDDLLVLMKAAADGQLAHVSARWADMVALTVVMAAKGYPGTPEKGTRIRKLSKAGHDDDVVIFHAGTRLEDDQLLADGGRVLGVTATGASVDEAREKAYRAVDRIDWPQGFCRRDIGWRALEREKAGAGTTA